MKSLQLLKAVALSLSVANALESWGSQPECRLISGSSTTAGQTNSNSPPSQVQPGQGQSGWENVGGSNGGYTYNGPPIYGNGALPASLWPYVFPQSPNPPPYPNLGSSVLGQNALPQGRTNGQSPLGTIGAPRLGPYVSGSGWESADPWGGRTAWGTNPYQDPPNTGVVRKYDFNIARGVLAPDGVQRNMVLVNNQFPGPTIEANWGDRIEITVTNNIAGPAEGVSIHWHGLLQTTTNYEDGIPGITQCPIAPGTTFTYSFIADLYGTSWWHSHFSAQYAGGIVGPMIIHGPKNCVYEEDLGPILLTDYYHQDYYSIVEDVMGNDLTKIAPFSQNNLINGKGNFNCSLAANNATCTPNAGLAKFQFTSGKTYRLRLINASAEGLQRFSVDNHTLEVVAYDFVPIVPYNTTYVTLGVGQRADVLVKANGATTGSYWMRSTISTTCSLSEQPKALAIIYYEHSNTTAEPTTTGWTIDDSSCHNDPLPSTVPFYPITPPVADTTVNVDVSFTINSTGHFLWTLDNSSFRTDYNNPILNLLQAPNATANIANFPREWNVYDFGANKSFIIVVNNQNFLAHPMHIHGHNMFVLSEGVGKWDGSIQGNPLNPARRDVQLIRPYGYIALQVMADNPGIWPFHCHIAWHVSGGLYLNILERPADIPRMVKSPRSCDKLCEDWDQWTTTGFVDMIDSGLKKRRPDAKGPARTKHTHFERHHHQHQQGVVRHTL